MLVARVHSIEHVETARTESARFPGSEAGITNPIPAMSTSAGHSEAPGDDLPGASSLSHSFHSGKIPNRRANTPITTKMNAIMIRSM